MEKTTGAVNLLNLTAQAGLANLPNIGKTAQPTGDVSFTDTLMKTSEVKPSVNVSNEAGTKKTVVENAQVNNRNLKTAQNVSTKNKESLDENEMKSLAEEVSKVIDEIKEKISSQFQVSEEEIEDAMEVLGLAMVDLLNGADLRNVIMQLTGTTDSIELLTNVELYNGVKEVTEFAETLMSEVSEGFSVQVDQLKEIVKTESFEKALDEAVNTVETADTAKETEKSEDTVKTLAVDIDENENEASERTVNVTVNVESDNSEKAAATSDTEVKVATENTAVKTENAEQEDEKPIEVKVEVEKLEGTRTSNPTVTETADNNKSLNNQQSGGKKQNLFDNSSKGQEINVTTTQTTQTVNSVGDIVETVTSYSTYADTENIMRQVTDYVRVNITEDVTKMEMQLHPASLGTVNMQINSQNGQITAHLTVQNELVKSVLESQMIKLQETFNEQGTKVTAIEVTVANYNLDSKSDNNYSQEREGRSGSSKKRNINLNEIDSFDELTDEEQLEAEVLKMNGGSVNYTA